MSFDIPSKIIKIIVRPFFARAAPPLVGDGMRKKDTEIPPKRAFLLTPVNPAVLDSLECTFRGFFSNCE
jgi:hypothetical protein